MQQQTSKNSGAPPEPEPSPRNSRPHIALVDDNEEFSARLEQRLVLANYRVTTFQRAGAAISAIAEQPFDFILSDLRLPDGDGMQVLDAAKRCASSPPVVLMTAFGDVPTAIRAIRRGAADFIEKPFQQADLLKMLSAALREAGRATDLSARRGSTDIAATLAGDDPQMVALRRVISQIALIPVDVLVIGETGTGKELVARCIHAASGRKGRFVAVNCAAVPDALFESELFGFEQGAFTGASRLKLGRFEVADGGTLFLDEIEAMPLHLQAKLLRVLQERELDRVGGTTSVALDLSVIAATKEDLRKPAMQSAFRPDLYYRLSVIELSIPPLRQRPGDILLLFDQFARLAAQRYRCEPLDVSVELRQNLLMHAWPGNVRELRSAADRAVLGMPPIVVAASSGVSAAASPSSLDKSLAQVEKALMEQALAAHRGSAAAACIQVGMSVGTFYRRLKQHGIDTAPYRR
jgi:DNA-binding NtrC family response regulator